MFKWSEKMTDSGEQPDGWRYQGISFPRVNGTEIDGINYPVYVDDTYHRHAFQVIEDPTALIENWVAEAVEKGENPGNALARYFGPPQSEATTKEFDVWYHVTDELREYSQTLSCPA